MTADTIQKLAAEMGLADKLQNRVDGLIVQGCREAAAIKKAGEELGIVKAAKAKPRTPRKPRVKKIDVPTAEQQLRRSSKIIDDFLFVYYNYGLTGKPLDDALANATGSQLTLWRRVNEDADFKKQFFAKFVPLVIASQKEMETETQRAKKTVMIVEVIDRCIGVARRAAGAGDAL